METQKVLIKQVFSSKLEGTFPEVPIPEEIDVQALTAIADDPVFVTVPFAKVGAVTDEGMVFNQETVDAFVTMINDQARSANYGHKMMWGDFPINPAWWIGAIREGDLAWGKAFIWNKDFSDFVKSLKVVNQTIETSFVFWTAWDNLRYNENNTYTLIDPFAIEFVSLDFLPEGMAALQFDERGEMTITAQAKKGNVEMPVVKIEDVPDDVRQEIIKQHESENGYTVAIAQQKSMIDNLSQENEELKLTVVRLAKSDFDGRLNQAISEIVNLNGDEGDGLKDYLRLQVQSKVENYDFEKATEVLKEFSESAGFVAMKKALVLQVSGGAVTSPPIGDPASKNVDVDKIVENAKKAGVIIFESGGSE
jgi:hypothetical protein